MPKRVDHGERRQQIANALLRTAATRGLHATGMREVAAEAGVSLRLVQYYFGTKEELLLFAMQHLAAQFSERGLARIRRIKETKGAITPRDVIAAILTEGLPADDERRTFTVLYTAYFALSLTDPALAVAPLIRNSGAVIDVIAAQLRAAQAAGDTPAHLDADLEALSLMTMSAGLGTSVLGGYSSPGQAQAVIDYQLDRLFPAPRPALRHAVAVLAGSRPAGTRRHRDEVARPPRLEERPRPLLGRGEQLAAVGRRRETVRCRGCVAGERRPGGVDVELHAAHHPSAREELGELKRIEPWTDDVDQGAVGGDAGARPPLMLDAGHRGGARRSTAGGAPRLPVGAGRERRRATVGNQRHQVLPDGHHVRRHLHVGAPGADGDPPAGIDDQRRRALRERIDNPAFCVVAAVRIGHLEAAVERRH